MFPAAASKSTTTGDFVARIFKGKSVGSVIGVGAAAAAEIWQAVTPGGLAFLETPVAESR